MIYQSKLNEIRVRQQLRQAKLILENFMFPQHYFFPRIILILKRSRSFRLNNKPHPEAGIQPQGFQLSESVQISWQKIIFDEEINSH